MVPRAGLCHQPLWSLGSVAGTWELVISEILFMKLNGEATAAKTGLYELVLRCILWL